MSVRRPIAVDLFSGAGGMSLGFEQAGFDVPLAVDVDPFNVATYRRNFPSSNTICMDIRRLTGNDIKSAIRLERQNIDVLFGGPPCQGFSLMGRRKADDPRSLLLYEFARLVSELRPTYFIVENVRGLLLGSAVNILDAFLNRVKNSGYSILEPIRSLNALDFGVPQVRHRVFILGYLQGSPRPAYPSISDTKLSTHVHTVWDAIADLDVMEGKPELYHIDTYYGALGQPSNYAWILNKQRDRKIEGDAGGRRNGRESLSGCMRSKHTLNTVSRFSQTLPGTVEPISHFYRLATNGTAKTLRAGTGVSYGSYTAPRPIHPIHPRCITVREAARLHSIPDWFQLHSTIWHGFQQIGNSVPPMLARQVASQFISLIAASGS